MNSSAELEERVRTLVTMPYLIALNWFHGVHCPKTSDSESYFSRVSELAQAAETVARLTGMDPAEIIRFPSDEDIDEVAEYLVDIFFDLRFEESVMRRFGSAYSYHVAITRSVAVIFVLSSIFRTDFKIDALPPVRRRVVRKQRAVASEALTQIGSILKTTLIPVRTMLFRSG